MNKMQPLNKNTRNICRIVIKRIVCKSPEWK